MHEPDQLARPERERLVATVPLVAVAFRRGERREERQCPDMARPRDGHEQVQTDPAQAPYLDEVAVAGAHRVAIDAGCGDLGAASPFDRLVDTDDQRAGGSERHHEESEQDAAGCQARPDGAVEHAMLRLEMRQGVEAHSAQGGTDHPSPRRQDGSGQEHVHVTPHRARKQRREWRQQCDNVCGEELHTTTSWLKWFPAYSSLSISPIGPSLAERPPENA